jgi:uncharacterized small protein (DUF1192 family)
MFFLAILLIMGKRITSPSGLGSSSRKRNKPDEIRRLALAVETEGFLLPRPCDSCHCKNIPCFYSGRSTKCSACILSRQSCSAIVDIQQALSVSDVRHINSRISSSEAEIDRLLSTLDSQLESMSSNISLFREERSQLLDLRARKESKCPASSPEVIFCCPFLSTILLTFP